MQELIKLIHNVELRSPKPQSLLYLSESGHLETKLYELVKSGEIKTDLEASEALYGENDVTAKYKMLKSRLKKKLYNQMHFIDFSTSKNEAAILEQKCLKLLYEASILVKAGESTLAEKLLSQILSIAEEAEFSNIILETLELQRNHYVEHFNRALYKNVESKIAKYTTVVFKEKYVDSLYFNAKFELGLSIANRIDFFANIQQVLEEIRNLWLETRSPYIYNRYFFLKTSFLELTGYFTELANTAQEADKLVNLGEVNALRFNILFCRYISIYGYLRSNQLEEGLKYAALYVSSFREGAINWFTFMENYVLLAIHNQDYKLAENLIYQVIDNPEYSRISKLAGERWKLYISYFNLISPKSIERTEVASKPLAELFSEITKDKRGFNVLVIILELLRRLEKGEYEKIQSQYENLKKYSSYHLKGDEAERVRTFFRLILLVIREGFDKTRCSSKGSYLFKKLKSLPTPAGAFAEVEIVPYEHLWEFILEHLEKKPFYV